MMSPSPFQSSCLISDPSFHSSVFSAGVGLCLRAPLLFPKCFLDCPSESHTLFVCVCVCVFYLFRAAPVTYGGSQARGLIGATAAGLHHSSRQRRVLNPLSEARDGTHNLMVPGWICFCFATMGTPYFNSYIYTG